MKKIILILSLLVFPMLTFASIDTDLKLGMKSSAVKELQTYLKKEKFLSGQPTNYFGSATKKAVIAWQRKNGISPANGIFGESSRGIYNSLNLGTNTKVDKTQFLGKSLILNKLVEEEISSYQDVIDELKDLIRPIDKFQTDLIRYAGLIGYYEPLVDSSVLQKAEAVAKDQWKKVGTLAVNVKYKVVKLEDGIQDLKNLSADQIYYKNNGDTDVDRVLSKIMEIRSARIEKVKEIVKLFKEFNYGYSDAVDEVGYQLSEIKGLANLRVGMDRNTNNTKLNAQDILKEFNAGLDKIKDENSKIRCTTDFNNPVGGYVRTSCEKATY